MPPGIWAAFLLILSTLFIGSHGFIQQRTISLQSGKLARALLSGDGNSAALFMAASDDDEEEEEEALALQDDDWRTFRAKLVMNEKSKPDDNRLDSAIDGDLDGIGSLFGEDFKVDEGPVATEAKDDVFTPLDPSQWAYESGDVIEQGAVILGGVEQEFGFGLRQQYFHKVAILVLDHSPTFTKGVILNRPSDLMLDDDVNPGKKWRVWCGGDVEGLNAQRPDIVCIHALKNEMATKASVPIMKDIQWTTFDNAKKLVKSGAADVRDFWVFVGYAGWGPGQLAGELERDSWYMVATDSQTLLKEMARQTEGADPRDAGLDTWNLLMNMIGRTKIAGEFSGGFDDLMLKEWAFAHLLSSAGGGGGGEQTRDPQDFKVESESLGKMVARFATEQESMEGMLLRASSAERSPFLLENQELHKSLVLIIADDDVASVGVILNRPSKKGLDVKVSDRGQGDSVSVTLPLRYGGQYAVRGQESLLWLHCSDTLRRKGLGSPVGDRQEKGIWKCTAQDVIDAVGKGDAKPEEFVAVSGVSVWEKNVLLGKNGIDGDIETGKFEVVPDSARADAWHLLLSQKDVLSTVNFSDTMMIAEEAWLRGSTGSQSLPKDGKEAPLGGLGENFDEEDDSLVFKTDVRVSELADDALQSWCATFLLGLPNLLRG